MLPIGTTTSAYIIQPPIVNTTTPGTATVHVPPDNVAPSVSGSQVDNNTKGNNAAPSQSEEQDATPADGSATQSPSYIAQSDAANSLNTGAQAPFIAQLAGQDDTQEANLALMQYEKLVAFSNVKYQPSYAFKPPAEPSSVFGRLLEATKNAPTVSTNTTTTTPAENTTSSDANTSVTTTQTTPDTTITAQQATQAADDQSNPSQPIILQTAIPVPASTSDQAISAYSASASRVAFQSAETTGNLA